MCGGCYYSTNIMWFINTAHSMKITWENDYSSTYIGDLFLRHNATDFRCRSELIYISTHESAFCLGAIMNGKEVPQKMAQMKDSKCSTIKYGVQQVKRQCLPYIASCNSILYYGRCYHNREMPYIKSNITWGPSVYMFEVNSLITKYG